MFKRTAEFGGEYTTQSYWPAIILLCLLLESSYSAPKSVTEREVLRRISQSKKVGIAVAIDHTKEPFRHASIAVALDGRVAYIISRRIRDKSSYFAVALIGSESVTTVEKVSSEKAKQLKLLPVWKTTNITDAKRKFASILKDEMKRFTIWTTNCRHHVNTSLSRVLKDETWVYISRGELSKFFGDLHRQDQWRCYVIFLPFMRLYMSLFHYSVLALIGEITSMFASICRVRVEGFSGSVSFASRRLCLSLSGSLRHESTAATQCTISGFIRFVSPEKLNALSDSSQRSLLRLQNKGWTEIFDGCIMPLCLLLLYYGCCEKRNAKNIPSCSNVLQDFTISATATYSHNYSHLIAFDKPNPRTNNIIIRTLHVCMPNTCQIYIFKRLINIHEDAASVLLLFDNL